MECDITSSIARNQRLAMWSRFTTTIAAMFVGRRSRHSVQSKQPLFKENDVSEPVVKCPECGALLVNVVSGAVCPKGCGNIYPKLSAEAQSQAMRFYRSESLPAALDVPCISAGKRDKAAGLSEWCDRRIFVVPGKEGFFRRVPRKKSTLDQKRLPPGVLLARCTVKEEIRVLWLRPYVLLNDAAAIAYPQVTQTEAMVQQVANEIAAGASAEKPAAK